MQRCEGRHELALRTPGEGLLTEWGLQLSTLFGQRRPVKCRGGVRGSGRRPKTGGPQSKRRQHMSCADAAVGRAFSGREGRAGGAGERASMAKTKVG